MMSPEHRYLNFALIVSVLFLMFAPNAAAETAKEQLQGSMDRVIEVLRTIPSPEDIERNRNSLREILLVRFDFAAMAKKSLGTRWNDLKGKQKEFVSVFTDFVEHSYMSTLGSYRGEKIVYDHDRSDGESAEVDTRVVGGEGNPIKIEYKLHLTDGTVDVLRCGYR
jgi:phospholipid transport system substrate-binding protein